VLRLSYKVPAKIGNTKSFRVRTGSPSLPTSYREQRCDLPFCNTGRLGADRDKAQNCAESFLMKSIEASSKKSNRPTRDVASLSVPKQTFVTEWSYFSTQPSARCF